MTIQQLQYFITSAKYSSVSRAAEELFVSQSAVSKSLKALEDELGTILIERDRRGIRLTPDGMNFLRDSYTLLNRFEDIKQNYTGRASLPEKLDVSSQHYIFAVAALARFAADKSTAHYALNIRECPTSEIIDNVASRISEIGFIYYNSANKSFILRELDQNGLEFTPLAEAIPHAYLNKDHPLASKEAVSLEELAQYPFIYYNYDTDNTDFAEEVMSPSRAERSVSVSDRNTLFTMIKLTEGYHIGSGYLLDGFTPDNITAVPVAQSSAAQKLSMTIGRISLKGQALSPAAEAFLEICREILTEKSF
ncbi:MAG: LysR family transcriptional regulator [Clostridia bacterium]|nr:LysR family transcriptional regulator [Clostridia bacterium]